MYEVLLWLLVLLFGFVMWLSGYLVGHRIGRRRGPNEPGWPPTSDTNALVCITHDLGPMHDTAWPARLDYAVEGVFADVRCTTAGVRRDGRTVWNTVCLTRDASRGGEIRAFVQGWMSNEENRR